MKIKIEKLHIKKEPANEVTSEKIFKPRRCRDKDGNWRFHEEGIFSPKIFGKLYKCSCGKNREIGTWCSSCGDRVVSKDMMPDFYIDTGILAPFAHADYLKFGKKATDIRKLMEYKAFMYDGELVEFDLSVLDLSLYTDTNLMSIGHKAAMEYSDMVTDEWVEENCSTCVSIPHPIYRPIIESSNKKDILGSMNDIIVDLLDKRAKILSFNNDRKEDGSITSKFHELTLSNLLYEKYMEVVGNIFELLVGSKKSILNQEVLAQPITGAIRAVLTNNDDLNEDTILIGYELIDTIYPHISKKCNGDIDEINKILEDEGYLVLVNRPPTIGEKSIIAMKPVVNKNPKSRFIISTNSIMFDGMAADTDGDVLLSVALYTKEANAEAVSMLPSKNYIGGSNGKIRNKMPEDFEYAMSEIYKNNPVVRDKIKNIIASNLPDKYKVKSTSDSEVSEEVNYELN